MVAGSNGSKRKGSPADHPNGTKRSPNSHDASPGRAGSSSDPNGGSQSNGYLAGGPSAGTKRIKTARACDSCRRKKIRCDVIEDDAAPLGDPNNGNGGLICAHCRQYGFECTFFLPITETRFKKKHEREREEAAQAQAQAAAAHAVMAHRMAGSAGLPPAGPTAAFPLHSGPLPSAPLSGLAASRYASYAAAQPMSALDATGPRHISATQEWPPRNPSSASLAEGSSSRLAVSPKSAPTHARPSGSASESGKTSPPPPNTRVLGPTSIAYIVHSTAFVPGAAIEEHDLKHHQTFEVGASGDGIIKFHKPPRRQSHHGSISSEADDSDDLLAVPDALRSRLAGDVAEKLVNTYFERIGYLFPVITKSEFLSQTPPPPLLLYAICGMAALSRETPREVLGAVKMTLAAFFKENDLLSNSSIHTVKALLIMSLHSDLHGLTNVSSGTRCWNRTGIAIRMAQDLGIHRDASGRDDLDGDAFFLEQKRRIWGCCVTADRCTSISLGHPLAIDLTDCDVRLPSPLEILRHPSDLRANPALERPFAFNTEMLKLSILFGRTLKTIYSPTGLMKTTDEEIVSLLADIDNWKESLPAELQYDGPDAQAPAGILHTCFACLQHLFFRVFMRISYSCPQHLSFSLNIERMTAMIKNAREAIEWVDRNEFYLDTLHFLSYSLVFCATIQYHAWMRRGDQQAFETLRKCKECVTRHKPEGARHDLSLRAKTGEVVALLFKSATGVYNTIDGKPSSGALNPTAGVTNRRTTDTVRGIVFKADQSKPGGGVYLVADRKLLLNDLPTGTILLHETAAGRVPALVRTSDEANGGWQAFPRQTAAAQDGKASASPQGQPSSDLTHIAGTVFQDAEGIPVDRRGSRMITMIPVGQPGMPQQHQLQLLQAAQQAALQQQQSGSTAPNPPPDNSAPAGWQSDAGLNADNGNPLLQHRPSLSAGNLGNVNPHLNDASWASTLASLGFPADAYTFDGQNMFPLGNATSADASAGFEPLVIDGFPDGLDVWGAWAQQLSRANGMGALDASTPGGGFSNSNGAQHSGDSGYSASIPAPPTLGSLANGGF
ncbi:hypothetical protein PSEUBRA_SCAF13g01932 [Ceraceosorus bombacis]|uniref:Zn(2)-C6 fungal-type domain-containing protein n=1 Tax=Ceraceosorus bombacis TaxID=401625 RepID=A0A0P1BC32_9BASI|nr:hypothetical protein PSEUBRA_SCAF13g01932 [Ceraceosorus bombacis]